MTAFFLAFSSLLIAVLAIAMLGGTAARLATSVRPRTLEDWRQHRPCTAIAAQSPWNPDYSLYPPNQFSVSHDRKLIAELEFARI